MQRMVKTQQDDNHRFVKWVMHMEGESWTAAIWWRDEQLLSEPQRCQLKQS